MATDAVIQLKDLLTPETMRLRVQVPDALHAVRQAGELLLASGGVEERYIDAMQQSLQTHGPYMVIVPGVALLHARPGDGVRWPCMSLLTLDPPVTFGNEDNDPVSLAIAFGTVDREKHLKALTALSALLADDQALAALRSSTSVEEALRIIAAVSAEISSF